MNLLELIRNTTVDFSMGGILEIGHTLNGQETAAAAAAAAAGILICFLGLKLMRLWAALFALAAGFLGGTLLTDMTGITLKYDWIPGAVAGVVLGAIAVWLYRFGIFITVWSAAGICCAFFMGADGLPEAVICTAAGLAAALLSIKFKEIITILITAVFGALMTGAAASVLLPGASGTIFCAAAAVCFAAGIIVQLLLESRKRKKASLRKAEEIRRTHSTADEVERARAVIDHLERMDENEDDDSEEEE